MKNALQMKTHKSVRGKDMSTSATQMSSLWTREKIFSLAIRTYKLRPNTISFRSLSKHGSSRQLPGTHLIKLVLSLEVTGLCLAMRVSSYEEWLHFPASFAARCGHVSPWISKPCTCFSLAASQTINTFKTWFQTGSHVQSPGLTQHCQVERGII